MAVYDESDPSSLLFFFPFAFSSLHIFHSVSFIMVFAHVFSVSVVFIFISINVQATTTYFRLVWIELICCCCTRTPIVVHYPLSTENDLSRFITHWHTLYIIADKPKLYSDCVHRLPSLLFEVFHGFITEILCQVSTRSIQHNILVYSGHFSRSQPLFQQWADLVFTSFIFFLMFFFLQTQNVIPKRINE